MMENSIRKLDINHFMEYLYLTFKKSFPSNKLKYASTKEIKNLLHF